MDHFYDLTNPVLIVVFTVIGFFLKNLISKIEENSRGQNKLITEVIMLTGEFKSFQKAHELIISDFGSKLKYHDDELRGLRERLHDLRNLVHQTIAIRELKEISDSDHKES